MFCIRRSNVFHRFRHRSPYFLRKRCFHLKYHSHKQAEPSANKGFKVVENLFIDFSENLAHNCGEMCTFTAVLYY